MIAIRSIALAIVLVAGMTFAAPLQAQTATLNVSARVVAECTVYSKRELVKLARKLNDPGLIRRCSKGVVSRVDQRVVKVASLQSRVVSARKFSRKRIVRRTVGGQTDVVLVTVTY